MISIVFILFLLLTIIDLSKASDICHGGDLEDEVQHFKAMMEANRWRTSMALNCIFAKIYDTCPNSVHAHQTAENLIICLLFTPREKMQRQTLLLSLEANLHNRQKQNLQNYFWAS